MRHLRLSKRNTESSIFVIHSIAFAPKEAFEGEFVDTTREAFRTALEISAFSLTQVSAGRVTADDRRRQHRHDDAITVPKRS